MRKMGLQEKIAGVLLAVAVMCCIQPNPAYAETGLEYAGEMELYKPGESVSPMYVQCDICRTAINFSGTTATCMVFIKGKSGTTKISGLMKLYDNTAGKQVTSWTISKSASYCGETKTATVTKGHNYTMSFSGKVYGTNSPNGEFISSSTSGTD